MRISIILTAILLFVGMASFAKDFEGVVTYQVEVVNVSPEASISPQMIPEKMVAYIKDGQLRLELETMMKVVLLTDGNNQTAHMLVEFFGLKYAMELDAAEIKKGKNAASGVELIRTSDRKTIAGQNCRKIIVSEGKNKKQVDVYCASNLKVDHLLGVGMDFLQHIEGLPLEFEFDAGGLTMHVTGQKITKSTLSDSKFIVPSDYEKADREQVFKLLGL